VITTQTANINRTIDSVLKYASKIVLSLSILVFAFSISSFSNAPLLKKRSAKTKNITNEKTIKREDKKRRKEKDALEVSSAVMNSFYSQFPNAEIVNWSKIKGYAVADFYSGNSERMAFFDFNNQLVGTGKYISFNRLPKNSIKEIKKNYNNYASDSVIQYNDNELNDNDLNLFGITLDSDGYYALMKDKSNGKEIVLQITPQGDVSFARNFYND
jgi:hypothetical protein